MPTLHTDDIDLYYETSGQGAPLLLLHGLGSRGEDWAYQTPFFAPHYQVITADMRGHGLSDKPPGPYSVPMMAGDVVSLLAGLGAGAAHVVGLSMGGMIAFQLAVDRPECTRSLVIVNSAPALVARSLRDWWRIRQRVLLAQLSEPARTGQFLSQRLFPKPEQATLRSQFIERWAQNDRQAYLAAMRALIGWSIEDRLHTIQCPVLVISGDRDYTPAEAKRAYTDLMPNAQLVVIEDSGHATPIDQADRFNRIVLEFLEQVQ